MPLMRIRAGDQHEKILKAMSPAYILMNPGVVFARGGEEAFQAVLVEMKEHHGPIYIVDGRGSAHLQGWDPEIEEVLSAAGDRGFEGTRIWGCESGTLPYEGWPGEKGDVYGSPEEGLVSIAPRMAERDVVICGAGVPGAGRGSLGAVTSSLAAMGWDKQWRYSDLAIGVLATEEVGHEDPDPELHLA